jgi:hypothetical protein
VGAIVEEDDAVADLRQVMRRQSGIAAASASQWTSGGYNRGAAGARASGRASVQVNRLISSGGDIRVAAAASMMRVGVMMVVMLMHARVRSGSRRGAVRGNHRSIVIVVIQLTITLVTVIFAIN